jgi:hypothetical protein
MTSSALRVRIAVAVAVAGGLALAVAGGAIAPRAHAQPKTVHDWQKQPDPACHYLAKGPTKETAGNPRPGIARCQACHNGADKGQAGGFVQGFKSNEFVLLNESVTWSTSDVHSIALSVLDGPLGKRMEQVLGRGDKTYSVTADVRCLTCHSADLTPTKPLAQKVTGDFATGSGGVNCTVCHGLLQQWQDDHYDDSLIKKKGDPLPWRSMSPASKWQRGMADLRNPVVKAALCVSCHVGNPAEGKIVTHEMYAAGHPPLPPFELAAYMEAEPKHWGYPTDPRLKFFDDVPAKDRWPLFHFHSATDESYLSRHYAVGAVATLRAEAELLLADAELAAKGSDLIDYARFDCYACHHDIPDEARQKRGYEGAPGRPPLRASSAVPARLVARHAEGIDTGGLKAKAAGFEEKWASLRKAATAKPFGHPEQVKLSARSVIDWCNGFLAVQCDTADPIYTAAHATRLRDLIREHATGPAAADPEAAFALGWGYRTLANEGGKTSDALDEKLAKVIPLNVRVAPFATGGRTPTPAAYNERMKRINAFDVGLFRDAFLE